MNIFKILQKIIKKKKNNSNMSLDTINYRDVYLNLLMSGNVDRYDILEISSAINNLSYKKLINLDKSLRRRSISIYYISWKNYKIKKVTKDINNSRVISNIVGLFSFHPDGYQREDALNILINIDHPRALPFIIIRTKDWVRVIRKKACNALLTMVNKNNFTTIIDYFSFINHIQKYNLDLYQKVMDKVNTVVDKLKKEEILLAISNSNDDKGKIFCYLLLIDKNEMSISEVDKIVCEKSPFVKFIVFKRLVESYTLEQLIEIIDKLFTIKSGNLREYLVRRLFDLGYYNTQESLEYLLLDKYIIVRNIAKYYIGKLGEFNYIDFYQKQLDIESSNRYALFGYLENATSEYISDIMKYLSDERKSVVRKVLITLAGINFNNHKELIIEHLASNYISISCCARDILIKNSYDVVYSDIYDLYKKASELYINRNCMIVLCKAPKWDAIAYIIEMLADENKELAMIGEKFYLSWQDSFNRSFYRASDIQIDRINFLLEKYKKRLDNAIVKYLRYVLK